jgi:hypothetical protein
MEKKEFLESITKVMNDMSKPQKAYNPKEIMLPTGKWVKSWLFREIVYTAELFKNPL